MTAYYALLVLDPSKLDSGTPADATRDLEAYAHASPWTLLFVADEVAMRKLTTLTLFEHEDVDVDEELAAIGAVENDENPEDNTSK